MSTDRGKMFSAKKDGAMAGSSYTQDIGNHGWIVDRLGNHVHATFESKISVNKAVEHLKKVNLAKKEV